MPSGKRAQSVEHLVVVGSSAGGIEALSAMLSNLPRELSAPIVIGQHLDPAHSSQLAELLSRRSTLPVRVVSEGDEALEPGIIYVVPPDRNVEITPTSVRFSKGTTERHPKPSVDLLFSSAAVALGERVIAVILSGSGSDGAAGARAVKKAGGTVIIQDPDTAAFPGMPLSLAPTTVDIIAVPERIGPLLRELLDGSVVPSRPNEQYLVDAILEDVRGRAGIDFSRYKTPTIMRRLQRRIAATDSSNLAGYMEYLRSHPEEYQQLINTFLIKVTEFFRDPDLFAYLQAEVLPELITAARRRGNMLRIWSAGTATGEEAYSLAILINEVLGREAEQFHVRIFATDADDDAIAFARRGIYPASAIAHVPEHLVARYFTRDEGNYQIKKRVRTMTVFGQHDLGGRPPFPNIDLVLFRNVLIYFTPELQVRTLKLFAYALRSGGILVLGKSETPGPVIEYFTPVNSSLKVFRREGDRLLASPAPAHQVAPLLPQRLSLLRRQPAVGDQFRAEQRTRHLEEKLLSQLPVGVVVVDQRYDIQSINAAARRMFSIHGPALGEDMIHLVRGIPPVALREAVDNAIHSGEPRVIDEVEVESVASAEERVLRITCLPQTEEGERTLVKSVMVVIEDVTAVVNALRESQQRLAETESTLDTTRRNFKDATDSRDAQLARLTETNQQLIKANEELTARNDELRSSTEELVVDTEETQAAMEEVETLNEELQATNEELETLNEELQSTIEELNTTNDDLQARSSELQQLSSASEDERARLQAVLSGMSDAVLVVTRRGARLLSNAAYDRLFGEHSAFTNLTDPQGFSIPPEHMPQQRLTRGETFLMEFSLTAENGEQRWFEASGQPIADSHGRTEWGMVVIRDITDRSLRQMQDEFIAVASYLMRGPLTPLQTFLQMLKREIEAERPDARELRYVDGALSQTSRLIHLVEDLIDAQRLQNGTFTLELQRTELNPIVAQVVREAQYLSELPVIRLTNDDEALYVRADDQRLRHAIYDLVASTVARSDSAPTVDVRLRKVLNEIELQVHDSGPPISQADISRVSLRNSFGRDLHSGNEGITLALYIVKQIVELHGGSFEVASNAGRRTVFTIRLPAVE